MCNESLGGFLAAFTCVTLCDFSAALVLNGLLTLYRAHLQTSLDCGVVPEVPQTDFETVVRNGRVLSVHSSFLFL